MVAGGCVHTIDNCHTSALTLGNPYEWWANGTLMCRLDEQVFDRLGGFRTLFHAILKKHTSLLLVSSTLNMTHYKTFYIINPRSCYIVQT